MTDASALTFVFSLVVLIFSVIIHEVSHGYAALFLGDRTAQDEGRLTLNPLKHIDPIGSIIFPALSILLGGFIFGWAKPVPFNPYNLRNKKWGEAIVAAAGPASNFLLAIAFGLALRLSPSLALSSAAGLVATIVLVNLMLGTFNLIPIPPLDGSRLLAAILPQRFEKVRHILDRYGLIIVILLIFILAPIASYVVSWLFTLITGISF
jgi:Zn-dependent protease